MLAAATAVAAQVPPAEWSWRMVATVAVPLAALVPVLSAGGVAYAGLFGIVLGAIALWARRQPSTRRAQPLRRLAGYGALGLVLFLSFSAPSLADAVRFGSTVNSELSGPVLGQLLRALPLEQVGGIWWAEDWRLPVAAGIRWDVNRIALVTVFVFAAVGIVLAMRRREGAVLAGLLAVAGVVAAIGPRTSPYGESKLYVILSPFLVLAAAFGIWALFIALAPGGRRDRALPRARHPLFRRDRLSRGAIGAGRSHGGDGGHRSRCARPRARAPQRERGVGQVLYRDGQVDEPGEIWFGPYPWELRTGFAQVAQHYDLDQLQLWYVNSFPAIVTRRAPDASRPPASFRLAYENRYYELWLRDTRSTAWLRHARTGVVHHLPLQGTMTSQVRPRCSTILRFARQATSGQYLVAARGPDDVKLDPTRVQRSPGWPPSPSLAETIVPLTPGQAQGSVFVPGGRYRVWLYGSSGRPIGALVDGHRVGTLKQVNTPAQWKDVGFVSLARGRHDLEIQRPGGSLAPATAIRAGSARSSCSRSSARRWSAFARDEARSLCGKRLGLGRDRRARRARLGTQGRLGRPLAARPWATLVAIPVRVTATAWGPGAL